MAAFHLLTFRSESDAARRQCHGAAVGDAAARAADRLLLEHFYHVLGASTLNDDDQIDRLLVYFLAAAARHFPQADRAVRDGGVWRRSVHVERF